MNKHTHIKSDSVCFTTKSKQSGFSLIEIMVAALVLSIGILGVVGLQIVGLKGTQQSYMKQQAMSVVQNLTERMRSNKMGVFTGYYELPTGSDSFNCGVIADCSTTSCSAEDLANTDLHNLVCGYKVGAASRTTGLRTIASDDISTFVDGGLTVICTDSAGCSTGDVSIEVNWTERAIGSETVGQADSLLVNVRVSQ